MFFFLATFSAIPRGPCVLPSSMELDCVWGPSRRGLRNTFESRVHLDKHHLQRILSLRKNTAKAQRSSRTSDELADEVWRQIEGDAQDE